jgi:hypothetical protein
MLKRIHKNVKPYVKPYVKFNIWFNIISPYFQHVGMLLFKKSHCISKLRLMRILSELP